MREKKEERRKRSFPFLLYAFPLHFSHDQKTHHGNASHRRRLATTAVWLIFSRDVTAAILIKWRSFLGIEFSSHVNISLCFVGKSIWPLTRMGRHRANRNVSTWSTDVALAHTSSGWVNRFYFHSHEGFARRTRDLEQRRTQWHAHRVTASTTALAPSFARFISKLHSRPVHSSIVKTLVICE